MLNKCVIFIALYKTQNGHKKTKEDNKKHEVQEHIKKCHT